MHPDDVDFLMRLSGSSRAKKGQNSPFKHVSSGFFSEIRLVNLIAEEGVESLESVECDDGDLRLRQLLLCRAKYCIWYRMGSGGLIKWI